MTSTHPQSPWRSYRIRRWLLWSIFLGYLPAMTVATSTGLLPASPLALAWAGAFALAGLWLALFRCPACRGLFHLTWWLHNPFARRCLHCGLQRYQEPPFRGAPPAA